MAGFSDIVKKAFYLGVGVASYAGEKAGVTLNDLRQQAGTLIDEMVARGEMTTEEAQKVLNEMVNRAQQTMETRETATSPHEPRRIEILADEEDTAPTEGSNTSTPAGSGPADDLRRQVRGLRDELRQLRRDL